MRIVFTGATGFIGRRLRPLLREHECLILSRQQVAPWDNEIHRTCDLADPEAWKGIVADFRPEACVHFAWEGIPDFSAERCKANIELSTRLLAEMHSAGASRIVVSGSCFEYGEQSGALPENTSPVKPGLFPSAKLALLHWLEDLSARTGVEYRWGRIFFSYGPGQRAASLVPAAREAARRGERLATKNPKAAQDFVHVDDVARAFLDLLERDIPSGIYNIGSGQPNTVSSVADMVAAYYGLDGTPQRPDSMDGFWADVSKLATTTGWRAQISLQEGIRQTLREFDAS